MLNEHRIEIADMTPSGYTALYVNRKSGRDEVVGIVYRSTLKGKKQSIKKYKLNKY